MGSYSFPVLPIGHILETLNQTLELAISEHDFSAPKVSGQYFHITEQDFCLDNILCQRLPLSPSACDLAGMTHCALKSRILLQHMLKCHIQ